MRIIIAGGSGLIGSALAKSYAASGDEVVILSRNPNKVTGMPDGVRAVQWDGKTIQSWAEEVENANVIVNLTGENLSGDRIFPSRWTKERKKRLLQSRVNSGNALTNAIVGANKKPSVFVQASGISYYGTHLERTFTEESEGGNDFLANLSKDWEASSQPVESLGVRRIVTRNGIVLSAEKGALPPLLLQYKLFAGGPIGSGKQIYSWIHLDDVVRAIRFLIEKQDAVGVYNFVSPNPLKNADFGKTIGKVMKRPHYFPLPAFAMRLAFGEVAGMVLEGQRVLPVKLQTMGFEFHYPELEPALQDLLNN